MKQLWMLLIILFAGSALPAQDTSNNALKTVLKRTVFFTATDPVEITLVSDFKTLKSKRQKKAFLPAKVTLKLPQLAPVSEEIQMAARGEFRRQTCMMPCLLLNFKNPKAPLLSGLKKMKLVCGCSQSTYDEELLLKEYLVYKIFNMLTDMSFGVRLTRMTYQDVQNRTKEYTQYGFLIEDVDDMAKRNGCREYEKTVPAGVYTERNQMTLVSMFQYMIGNTDWSLPNNHNIKFIQLLSDSTAFPYIVPYDFDYCGLVNAPYAIPQPEFGIERVTDRYYRGITRSKEEVNNMVQLFKEKKDFIYAMIDGFDLLKKNVRTKMIAYLDEFYHDLDDKYKLKYMFEQASIKN